LMREIHGQHSGRPSDFGQQSYCFLRVQSQTPAANI